MEMLVNRATGLIRKPLEPETRVRRGKTAKDKKSGSWANRLKNQQGRAQR